MLGERREALAYYREASLEQSEPFRNPEPVRLRGSRSRWVQRSLSEEERQHYHRYSVDLGFTVTREGRATDIVVLESNAPDHVEYGIAESLRQMTFRPRFLDGEPVDTYNVHRREEFYVAR